MSATQHDTFSTRNIIVLGGLLFIALFIGEIVIGPHSDQKVTLVAVDSIDDIAMRIRPVVVLEDLRANMKVAATGGEAADQSPEQLYQGACLACHSTGAAGAPKLGDAEAWKPRRAKGLEALLSSALNGIGAMPPRGGSQYDDSQIQSVIEYILGESK